MLKFLSAEALLFSPFWWSRPWFAPDAEPSGPSSAAARTIDRLLAVFLGRPVAGGWIDHVDATGAPIVNSMPASTLYHIFLAAAEADRVWGKQERAEKQPADME